MIAFLFLSMTDSKQLSWPNGCPVASTSGIYFQLKTATWTGSNQSQTDWSKLAISFCLIYKHIPMPSRCSQSVPMSATVLTRLCNRKLKSTGCQLQLNCCPAVTLKDSSCLRLVADLAQPVFEGNEIASSLHKETIIFDMQTMLLP